VWRGGGGVEGRAAMPGVLEYIWLGLLTGVGDALIGYAWNNFPWHHPLLFDQFYEELNQLIGNNKA